MACANRNLWTNEEILTLLEIIREKKINNLFDGKRYKNVEIYRLIEEEMEKRGYSTKNGEQIKNKWKSLKTAYNTCKKENTKSGAARKECDYFDILDEILGTRPSSSVQGLDTAEEPSGHVEGENIEVLVDPSVTDIEMRDFLNNSNSSTLNVEGAAGKEPKRTYHKKTKTTGLEEFMQQQRELMNEFYKKEEEREEAANKIRSEELQLLLSTFTAAIDRLATTPYPLYPTPAPFQYLHPQQAPSFQPSTSHLVPEAPTTHPSPFHYFQQLSTASPSNLINEGASTSRVTREESASTSRVMREESAVDDNVPHERMRKD